MKNLLMVVASRLGNLRAPGTYLLVALIIPGGSLLALLLWLHHHKQAGA